MDKRQIGVNYFYFGLFFIFIWLVSISGILVKSPLAGPKTFFLCYATGQALFETLLCIFLTWSLERYIGFTSAMVFVGATFIILLFHLLDFLMERILDLSIWETIGFVLDESWDNFLYLLDASGIALWIWAIGFLGVVFIPFIGIALYSWTMQLSTKKPFLLRPESLFQAFFCIPAALLFWEFSASKALLPDSYTSLLKALPWKWTFLPPKTIHYPIEMTLGHPPEESDIQTAIDNAQDAPPNRPNIYLFVLESLREDFITPETAPHLYRFKERYHHFDLALSNANGSHLSWFSIFHSQFSHLWQSIQKNGWKMGSPPLQLLKKWGYNVRLYSSAQLKYYNMEELLFGEKMHLVDSYRPSLHPPPFTAADADAKTVAEWKKDIQEHPEKRGGELTIFFWDSTHFNYSWPQNWHPKFIPISNEIDYFNVFQSRNKIEKIKNRYRNAVHYLDSLFGEFLKNIPDLENAIVIVTGDHGEEFFERGHLFHGSHLTHEQTNIPLYMKFGPKTELPLPKIVSQMDIFPSILHHLSEKEALFLEGRSIFSQEHWPYAVISRNNAGRSPYEFCLHNGEHKLIAQFENKKNILSSKTLKIRSLWDCRDACVFTENQDIDQWIQKEFGPAIDRLFNK